MSTETLQALLPWLIIGNNLLVAGLFYVIGVQRAFARLGYWSENLNAILSTLQPYCGDR